MEVYNGILHYCNWGDHKKAEQVKDPNPSNPLDNWTSWQTKWQKVEKTVASKLNLEPENILMNYSDGVMQINTEKTVLDYAKIPTEFDKYRGKPDFYQLPTALPKRFKNCVCKEPRCCCRTRNKNATLEPTYFAVKTKPEAFVVPSVELVGVPKTRNIGKETRNIYERWQRGSYRREQMNKLSDKIKNIVPHWPNFDDFVVIGTKVPKESDESVPVKETNEALEEERRKNTVKILESVVLPQPKYWFKINGISFSEDYESCGTRKLRMFFEHDVSSKEISKDCLSIENKGLVTMRFSWKKWEKFRLFRGFTEEKWDKHGFYFSKNELVILPGQREILPIWFQTENSGNYSESWELITNPTMWKEDFHVILHLQSYAYFKDREEKLNALLNHIETQTRNILIKDILNSLVENVKYTDKPVIPCVYGEPELFQLANLQNGRPSIIFDKTLVDELISLYEKIKTDEQKWNYSIVDLKNLARKKDANIFLENKSNELKQRIERIQSGKALELKKKSSIKVKKGKKHKKEKGKSSKKSSEKSSKKSKEKSSKKSKNSKKSKKTKSKTSQHSEVSKTELVAEIKEHYEYGNQLELWNIEKRFDFPVVLNSEREKYFACVSVLKGYFTKMCDYLDLLNEEKDIEIEPYYPPMKNKLIPLNELPDRLIYEYFEHHYVPAHVYNDFYPFEVKRKPKILQNIPPDDAEALYCTYFNKEIVSKEKDSKGKKSKKGKKDKGSKGNKKSKKDKGSKGSKKSKKDKESKGSKKSKKDKGSKGSKKSKKDKISKKSKENLNKASVESFNPYSEEFIFLPQSTDCDTSPVTENPNQGLKGLSKEQREDYKYKEYVIIYSCLGKAVDAIVDTLESFDCIVSYPTLKAVTPLFP